MSRAAWAGLLLLGAGLGLIAFFLTRGLPDEVRAEAQRTAALVADAEKEVAAARDRLEGVVAKDPGYLQEQSEIKAGRELLAQREASVQKARALLAGDAAKLLDKDDYGDRGALWAHLADVRQQANEGLTGLGEPEAVARDLLRYKQEFPQILGAARENLAAARAVPQDPQLETQFQLAITSYPEAKDKLQQRYDALKSHAGQVAALGEQLERLAQSSPPDYAAVGRTARGIGEGYDKLRKMKADLLEGMAALSRSVDQILIDMKEEAGRYFHKYRYIENGQSRETDWVPVSRAEYEQHKQHLGMSIYSKPEGALPEDATKAASPPGYNYVGNARYGYWENRNGQSFWVFYGQYALLRDLLWGPGFYQPVRRDTWSDYGRSRSAGQPYYGQNKEYGTEGSRTKTRYAGSRYMTQRRVQADTRPQGQTQSRPGGYAGSRYQGASGSQRSGGYRSSPYRSRSFGGGGK